MKTIPLANSDGQTVSVDDADYLEVSHYAWRILCGDHKHRAVVRADRPSIRLDAMIMNPAPGLPVIHIDGEYHNCQRDNLYVPESGHRAKPTRPHTCATLDDQSATEVMRAWLSSGQAKWAVRTTEIYARTIAGFLAFLATRDGKPADPAKLTVSDVAQYLSHVLKDRGRNTANSYRAALKQFFTWRTECYGVDNIGAAIPRITPEAPKQRILTEDEYRAILNTAEPMEKDVMQFLAHTGLKRGEFLDLKWSHVTSGMAAIRIGEQRIIPLSSIAQGILERYKGQGDTIPFVTRYGEPSAINRLCHRVAGRAGIPRFDVLALRHYFTTRLAKAGVSIQKVSKVLGHSCIACTEKLYPHLWVNDLAGIVDVLTD
jgi:integrase